MLKRRLTKNKLLRVDQANEPNNLTGEESHPCPKCGVKRKVDAKNNHDGTWMVTIHPCKCESPISK